ncbi:hypothetical protein [Humisphaera borealis]|uniref:Lipoprotein n=1 Tax=Humisphaera borealis TaxID=2807512 RepID=A0A7M2WQ96_9BACT|nr:hypothetical protein [Humisphaera borealis]QOV87573.1 hypothetical protein IPV69_14885 [Humisphaera borealis]
MNLSLLRQSSFVVMLVSTMMLLCGCGSTVVPTTGPRPATSPAAVALFQDPPSKYEVLGIIKTEGSFEWEEVGQMQKVIDELKEKAAAMGGNGLLLQVPEYRLRAVGTYDEEPYIIPIDKSKTRNAMATAIYVHKK